MNLFYFEHMSITCLISKGGEFANNTNVYFKMRWDVGEVLQREGCDFSEEKRVFIALNQVLYIYLAIILLPLMGMIMDEVKQGNVSCINLYDQDFYC